MNTADIKLNLESEMPENTSTITTKYYNSKEVTDKIIKYFDSAYVGSILLIADGLEPNMINDIDIIIYKKSYWKLHDFLLDLGFIQKQKSYTAKGYADFISGDPYIKEHCLPIHILVSDVTIDKVAIFTTPELVKVKYERSSLSDLTQLHSLLTIQKNRYLS